MVFVPRALRSRTMRIWLGTTGLYAPPPLSMLVEARARSPQLLLASRVGEDSAEAAIFLTLGHSNAPMESRILSSLWDEALLAHRLAKGEWTDLGDPYRVFVTLLERNGSLPGWAKL
jgi:hypothetical protein